VDGLLKEVGFMDKDKVWISICSAHAVRNYECSRCNSGYWLSQKELDEEQELFTNDYPEWFRQHNNGKEPTESAMETWRFLTREKKE
jgi:hypothetical protein